MLNSLGQKMATFFSTFPSRPVQNLRVNMHTELHIQLFGYVIK